MLSQNIYVNVLREYYYAIQNKRQDVEDGSLHNIDVNKLQGYFSDFPS